MVPKWVPVSVTEAPAAPEAGETAETVGVGRTVKATPLLAKPPSVTTTLPVVAPAGTTAVMELPLQAVTVALAPLKVTVEEPWVASKLVPVRVTAEPTGPEVGLRLVIAGR